MKIFLKQNYNIRRVEQKLIGVEDVYAFLESKRMFETLDKIEKILETIQAGKDETGTLATEFQSFLEEYAEEIYYFAKDYRPMEEELYDDYENTDVHISW